MSEITTLHVPFAKWLTEEGIPFIRARSDRESTIAEGHPDFTLTLANRCLCIEFKTKEGALSKEQKDRIAVLEKAGNYVHVLRDLGIAIETVQQWRATLGEVLSVQTAAKPAAGPQRRVFGGYWWEKSDATGRFERAEKIAA